MLILVTIFNELRVYGFVKGFSKHPIYFRLGEEKNKTSNEKVVKLTQKHVRFKVNLAQEESGNIVILTR